MDVENSKIRGLAPPELAFYLRQLIKNRSEESITDHLLPAVERQSLPPSVLAIWLSIARTSKTLLRALKQEFSVYTRRVAIKRLCKLLRRRRWRETWDGVGGTQGILALSQGFSVSDVKFCLALLPHTLGAPDRAEKQANLKALLRGLLPKIYPDAIFKTLDERPLIRYYQLLLPGCNARFVDEILRNGRNSLLRDGRFDNKTNSDLLREHHELLRRQCLDDIFGSTNTAINVEFYFDPLLSYAPGLPTTEPGISESMAFSLLVLRKLVSQPDVKVHLNVLTGLVEPFLRRAHKKKVGFATIKEVMDLSINYLSSHPNEAKQLSFKPNSFLYRCVRLWAASRIRKPDFESGLISILRILPSGPHRNLRDYTVVISWVQKPLRYGLLRLLFLHMGDESVDIDDEDDFQEAPIKNWPCNLFFSVNREEALDLLKRLRNTSPRDDFIEKGTSILAHPKSQDLFGANSSILLNLLEAETDQQGVLERATAAVEAQKKKAVTSREQTDRAFYAKSALFYAISSGALEVYRETLIWARRFIRDPLTVKSVFATSAANTADGIKLLSGIPSNFARLELSDVSSGIVASNKVVWEVFETACSALKEPSFYRPDWAGTLELIGDVVNERIRVSGRLQDTLHLTNDQLYNSVWSDTLDLLIRIEKIGLQPDYERLQLQHPSGLLKPKYNTPKQELSSSSLRFIDDLAKARDSLWREFRPTINAAVAALPPPVPRGLPIQSLCPGFEVGVDSAHGFTPFIFSRVEAVVFMEPDAALLPIPEDDETRSAIGHFFDSYTYALNTFILQGNSPAVRESRTMRAWRHCLDSLSVGMTPTEAHRTWKGRFTQALPNFQMTDLDPQMNMNYPLFPFGAEVGGYTEWNPAEAFERPLAEKSRRLSALRYLDCTLGFHSLSPPSLGATFMEHPLQTEGFEPPNGDIWWLPRLSSQELTNPALREGLIVSALLFLEQYIPEHKSVLLKPFPSSTDVRYPDMWLDLSFAEVKDIGLVHDDRAFGILDSFLSTVPPSILYRLAEAALDALFRIAPEDSDAKIANLERVAYRFLCLLAGSDRPSLATNFILKAVIDRPDSSSWHRKLLSIGFLRSLSASQAKDLIEAFADAIQQKTKAAAELSRYATKPGSNTQPKAPTPYVKITTIKYLAQLLQDADFVPESFAVGILSGLFETSTHIDVRTAIVESLMTMLEKCQDDSFDTLGKRILRVLDSTIPIASRLDERHEVQEEEWEEARKTGKLPAIYEQGSTAYDRTIPPILGAILNPFISGSLECRWEKRLLKQILLPILEASTAVNARWLEIYTTKHALDLQSLSLPLLPVKVKLLKDILQRGYRYLPTSFMDLYQKFILMNISPPPEVAELNEKIRDPNLNYFPEAKHWLSLYGHGPYINHYDGFDVVALLRQDWKYPESLITVEKIQNHVFEHAKLLLSTNQSKAFDNFINAFAPRSYPDTIDSKDWLKNAKPVLQRIISLIDSLRTPAWQRNRKREPEVLPQTLKYKLWLLPYPAADATVTEVSKCAGEIRSFVSQICKPDKVYHEELPEIRATIKRVLPVHRANMACFLGSLSADLSLADLLCVDLAKELFVTASVPTDEKLIKYSRRVVKTWSECVDEGVRRKGVELSAEKGLFGMKGDFELFD